MAQSPSMASPPLPPEAEQDYETDPDDVPLPSMRRREASDDESSSSDAPRPPSRRDLLGYDAGDSDGQGGAPGYDDDEEEDFGDEEEELDDDEINEIEEKDAVEVGHGRYAGEVKSQVRSPQPVALEAGLGGVGDQEGFEPEGKEEGGEEVEGEVKKENEPFAVPTAGAFYMHDDRFQENGRGRHRRMPGGRRLWETKDDHAWVHDRFEEMNLQDVRHNEGRRMSRGRFRGRGSGKTRGIGRGYGRGNKPQAYYDRGNDQNHIPKSVRGRGPRRYVPAQKNNSEVFTAPITQQNQSARPQELTSNSTVGRQPQPSNVQPDAVLPRKHVFASSLNSASPPFYPSSSSNQDISVNQKRDVQAGSTNKTLSSSMQMKDNFLATQSGSFLKGKSIADAAGHDKLYMYTPLPVISGKSLVNPQLQFSESSLSPPTATQSSYSVVPGRGLNINVPPNYQQALPHNQIVRVPPQIHPSLVQQKSAQATLQPALRSSAQKLGQQPSTGNQASSLPQAQASESFEVGESEKDSPTGSSKSKSPMLETGKTSNPGLGKGTYLYNGAQVIGAAGAMGLPLGDQGFPGTPALLPVMQFPGQHHGGLGVPAVGMALPGYVAQSQLGFGNSEMTWLPMLAGAAGALGASYCPPYIALDTTYCARPPSGQTSSSVSPRETSSTRPATTWKPPQRPEILNDEFAQRQSKPRRYSEMNFGQ